MHKANYTSETPSFARPEAYNFVTSQESYDIYKELSQIGEEIEQCRAANAQFTPIDPAMKI